jgi:hypothetical protein
MCIISIRRKAKLLIIYRSNKRKYKQKVKFAKGVIQKAAAHQPKASTRSLIIIKHSNLRESTKQKSKSI